jgi:type IV pilus assembly protein PilX
MRSLQRPLPHPPAVPRQRGFVLVVGLLFLIVLTLLSISMFHSFDLQEKIAGSTREKQRALEAAESALQYGEWWLGQGHGSTGAACTAVANANVLSQMQVCSNPLATPTTLPWTPARADYLPANMTVQTGGGTVTTTSNAIAGDVNYSAKPGMYIYYMGLAPGGNALLYQVSAFGYGGGTTAAAVVQSTYQVTSADKPLDQP